MQNENVLFFLYEKLFPVTAMSNNQTQASQNTHSVNKMMRAGSQLTLMTQEGLNHAQFASAVIGGGQSHMSESFQMLPGSRLNLHPKETRNLESKFVDATNYTRKSFGGNTQQRYKTKGTKPIDSSSKAVFYQSL